MKVKRVISKEGSKQTGKFVWIGIYSIFCAPFMSQDRYNAELEKQLESLNGLTLSASLFQLLEFVKITKKFSQQFKDCDKETEQIVKVIPVLRPYYRELYNHVKDVRKKYHLK
jgi:hypothetical protein